MNTEETVAMIDAIFEGRCYRVPIGDTWPGDGSGAVWYPLRPVRQWRLLWVRP